jgi:hypothetical protein
MKRKRKNIQMVQMPHNPSPKSFQRSSDILFFFYYPVCEFETMLLQHEFIVDVENENYKRMQKARKFSAHTKSYSSSSPSSHALVTELKADQVTIKPGMRLVVAFYAMDPIANIDPEQTPILMSGGICMKIHEIESDMEEAIISFYGLITILRLPKAQLAPLHRHNCNLFMTVSIV